MTFVVLETTFLRPQASNPNEDVPSNSSSWLRGGAKRSPKGPSGFCLFKKAFKSFKKL